MIALLTGPNAAMDCFWQGWRGTTSRFSGPTKFYWQLVFCANFTNTEFSSDNSPCSGCTWPCCRLHYFVSSSLSFFTSQARALQLSQASYTRMHLFDETSYTETCARMALVGNTRVTFELTESTSSQSRSSICVVVPDLKKLKDPESRQHFESSASSFVKYQVNVNR